MRQHKYGIEPISNTLNLKQLFDDQTCAYCGNTILFGVYLNKSTYQYKRKDKKGRVRYYCRYNCMTADERREPIDGRRTKAVQKAKKGSG